jgi:hypothetical protein
MQHPGDIDPKKYGSGSIKATATMGKPLGQNASSPKAYIKKHAKEPVLPERKPGSYAEGFCVCPQAAVEKEMVAERSACSNGLHLP